MKSSEILLGTIQHNSVIHFIIGREYFDSKPKDFNGCSCFRWKVNEDWSISVAMTVSEIPAYRKDDMPIKHVVKITCHEGEEHRIVIRALAIHKNININS